MPPPSARTGCRSRGPIWLVSLALLVLQPGAGLAQAEPEVGPVDRTWPLEGGEAVTVRAPHVSVHVDAWDRGELRVRKRDPNDRYGLRVDTSSPSRALVEVTSEKPVDAGRARRDTIHVTVPRSAALSVTTYWAGLSVAGVEGDVAMESYFERAEYRGRARRVRVEGFHEPVRIEAPAARDVVASAGGGDVRVATGGGTVRVETVRGDIFVESGGAVERAEVGTTGGSILFAAALAAGASITLDSHHEDIEIRLDPGARARFELESHRGEVDVDDDFGPHGTVEVGPRGGRRLRFTLGSGGAVVRASSFHGDIRLTAR